MNFNLLKDIELPLKEQDEVLRRAPSEVVSGSRERPEAVRERAEMGVAPLEKGLSLQRLGFKINGFQGNP